MTLNIPKHPFSGVGKRIEKLCRKAIFEFSLIESPAPIAVALSGGKDSLTLLFLLHALSGKGLPNFDLHAIYVSGAFSCGASIQKNYLESICKHLGVNFIQCHTYQTLDKLECYSCSRERRKLIFNAAKNVGAHTIAFGHHQDDHIQTLLMNLSQKGEFEGNLPKVPMKLYDITIIRPLFLVEEKDIIQFANTHEFARVTCQCPVGQNSKRKQAQKHFINLEKDFPFIKKNFASAGLKYGSKKALKESLTLPVKS